MKPEPTLGSNSSAATAPATGTGASAKGARRAGKQVGKGKGKGKGKASRSKVAKAGADVMKGLPPLVVWAYGNACQGRVRGSASWLLCGWLAAQWPDELADVCCGVSIRHRPAPQT